RAPSRAPRRTPRSAGADAQRRPRAVRPHRASRSARTSEKAVGRLGDADVLPPQPSDDAPARGSLEEAELQEERLVDVLDRVRLLAERDRNRRETDRAAAELVRNRRQELAVCSLETGLVDLQ